MINFDKFPNEMLLNVFSFLNPRNLGRVAQASKKMKLLSEQDVLWLNFLGIGANKNPFENSAKEIYRQYRNLFTIPGSNLLEKIVSKELTLTQLLNIDKLNSEKSLYYGIDAIKNDPHALLVPYIFPQGGQNLSTFAKEFLLQFPLHDNKIFFINISEDILHSRADNIFDQSENTIMRQSSCILLIEDQIDVLKSMLKALTDRFGKDLPLILIMTKKTNRLHFSQELAHLDCNMLGIVDGNFNPDECYQVLRSSVVNHDECCQVLQSSIVNPDDPILKVLNDLILIKSNFLTMLPEEPKQEIETKYNRCLMI